jgi:hypothetical protein
MGKTAVAFRVSAALLAALAADIAYAQRTMYSCPSGGRTVMSDRPCEGGSAASYGWIGPTNAARPAGSQDRTVAKASDVLNYLSPECAELREGLRNGPARGITSRTYSDLLASYQRRCGEEEQQANRRLAEDNRLKREIQAREAASEKFERDRVKLTREQCDEMYRIAHGKRPKLATMSPGERADFDRFEATRQARCGAA